MSRDETDTLGKVKSATVQSASPMDSTWKATHFVTFVERIKPAASNHKRKRSGASWGREGGHHVKQEEENAFTGQLGYASIHMSSTFSGSFLQQDHKILSYIFLEHFGVP